MAGQSTKALLIKRDGQVLAVVDSEADAMRWLHNNAPGSVHHSTTYEGYEILAPEPWDDDTAIPERRRARGYLYGDEFHNSGGCKREGRLGQENCAQCCLQGYEPRGGFGDGYSVVRDGPNVAGWTRVYVQAQLPIPSYWRDAFMSAFNSDNRAYADALARDVATFGVMFTPRVWKGQKAETLAAMDR